jgi:hypothetical protein
MVAWVPPDAPADVARYEAIARDVVLVAAEAPLEGDRTGERTAILMSSIASLESRYERDVDEFRKTGDHGAARGLLQSHRAPGEQPCDSRVACLRQGRERIRESIRLARRMPLEERLGPYCSGRVQRTPTGRARMARADEAYSAWRRAREVWA